MTCNRLWPKAMPIWGFLRFHWMTGGLRTALVCEEPLLAVGAPALVARVLAAPDLAAALEREPMLALNLDRPKVDEWLHRNGLWRKPVSPAVTGQDMRALRRLVCAGFSWTIMPAYLCASALTRGELAQIPAPIAAISTPYFLAWTPSALRRPRLAHARQTLIWGLSSGKGTARPIDE